MLANTQIWYDWHGANTQILYLLYGNGVELARPYLYILEFIGDYKNVGYFAFLMALLCGGQLLFRALSKNKIDGYFIRSQVAWILSFIIGYLAVAGVVGYLKEFAHFPRPFLVLSDVKMLYAVTIGDPSGSFPSGHAAIAGFLTVIFWSRFKGIFSLVLLAMLVAMCWYRVAIGVHFPADVLYGALIGLLVTAIIRNMMCAIFKVWR